MTGELYINGKDAFTTWGANMGKDFIDKLLEPCSLKNYVENSSRLEHGKHIIVDAPKLASRELQLMLTLQGSSETDLRNKRTALLTELYKGNVTIRVPKLGTQTYKMVYRKGVSFGMNTARTFCKLTVKFDEPNPNDR